MPGSFCLITNVLQQTDGHNCTFQTYTLKYAVKLKGVAKQLLNNKRDAFASLIQLYDHTIKFKYEMYYKSQLHLFNTSKKNIKTLIAQNVAEACGTWSFVQLPMKANK